MSECCVCNNCAGAKWIVVGVLVLLNALFGFLDWGIFIGMLFVLKGIMYIAKPACEHLSPQKSKKKKRI